jgi:hypothetical protein
MGVNAMLCDVMLSVSPLVIAFGVVRANEYKKFPAVRLSHTDTCEIVSEPDAQDAQDGSVAWIAFEPAEAAAHAMITRVVFADAAVVPAAPGSAV